MMSALTIEYRSSARGDGERHVRAVTARARGLHRRRRGQHARPSSPSSARCSPGSSPGRWRCGSCCGSAAAGGPVARQARHRRRHSWPHKREGANPTSRIESDDRHRSQPECENRHHMTSRIRALIAVTLTPLLCLFCATRTHGESDRARCPSDGKTYLQVLGSGGPMHAEGRGGSASALWLLRPSGGCRRHGRRHACGARACGSSAGERRSSAHHTPARRPCVGRGGFSVGRDGRGTSGDARRGGPRQQQRLVSSLPEFFERLIGPKGAFPTLERPPSGKCPSCSSRLCRRRNRGPSRCASTRESRSQRSRCPTSQHPRSHYRLDGPTFSVVFAGDQWDLILGSRSLPPPRTCWWCTPPSTIAPAKNGRLDDMVGGIPESGSSDRAREAESDGSCSAISWASRETPSKPGAGRWLISTAC